MTMSVREDMHMPRCVGGDDNDDTSSPCVHTDVHR